MRVRLTAGHVFSKTLVEHVAPWPVSWLPHQHAATDLPERLYQPAQWP